MSLCFETTISAKDHEILAEGQLYHVYLSNKEPYCVLFLINIQAILVNGMIKIYSQYHFLYNWGFNEPDTNMSSSRLIYNSTLHIIYI